MNFAFGCCYPWFEGRKQPQLMTLLLEFLVVAAFGSEGNTTKRHVIFYHIADAFGCNYPWFEG